MTLEALETISQCLHDRLEEVEIELYQIRNNEHYNDVEAFEKTESWLHLKQREDELECERFKVMSARSELYGHDWT